MESDLARDEEGFANYVSIWRRYLVEWCRMSDRDFEVFVDEVGAYSAGVIFHEEPWYHVFNYLTDPGDSPLPFPDAPNHFFRWEWFNYKCLHRAIYRDVEFDDMSADDDAWRMACDRATAELEKHGFKLRDYSVANEGRTKRWT